MTQTTQQGTSADPLTLPYRHEPMGDVVASDAALLALKKTRPWALLFAIVLFVYSLAGLISGSIWLAALIMRHAEPAFPVGQFMVITTGNLMFAPIALVGGVLTMRYIGAAGRAFNHRSSDELERALIALKRIWQWAGVVVLALFAFPVIVLFIAACMNLWP